MPSSCVFEFDRPDPVYYSGEVIRARINLTTDSPKNIRSAYIKFIGEAKVRWEESHSRTRNGKTEHYTEYYRANETYLNTETNVALGGTLPPGTHTYTCEIPLPVQCPTSCSEQYGQIQYELKLVLDRPMKFDNVYTQPLTIIKQLNLNVSPEHLIPLKADDVKYFCCWPCSSGPVLATLTIPFGGYAPGQVIKYTLELDNQSHKYDMEGLELRLKQHYKFVAHTPHHKTRYHSNTLAKTMQVQNCLRLQKRIIEGELLIPAVPPSSQDSCIITVSYDIKMTIGSGLCHTDSEIVIPITIGTVPLLQSASDPTHLTWIQPVPAQPPSAPNMTPDDINSDKPPSYDIYKPPSFEEATTIGGKFVDTDVDERIRADGFIPKYPMYTNFAVPTAPPPANGGSADAPFIASRSDMAPPYSAAATFPYPMHQNAPAPPTNSVNYGWST